MPSAKLICAAAMLCSSALLYGAEPPAGAGNGFPTREITEDQLKPLTGQERWDIFVRNAFLTPGAFFRAAGPALGAHLGHDPEEWGQGAAGYSKRLGNRFGRFTIQDGYKAGIAAALGHEVRYVRSKRQGFFPRAGHAIAAEFVTYNSSGARVPNIASVGSAVGASFTANLWMPDRDRTASNAMRNAGVQIGVRSAFDILREFSPEIKRAFKRR